MSFYPEALTPDGNQLVILPSGARLNIRRSQPKFVRWSGVATIPSYGKKPVLNFRGEQLYPELVILRILQEEGWNGVWVDSFMNKFRSNADEFFVLPLARQLLIDRIRKAAGGKGGCFDVFAWKDDRVLFAEAKWKGKDQFRHSQKRWLEAAVIQVGLPTDSFLIVEWTSVGGVKEDKLRIDAEQMRKLQ